MVYIAANGVYPAVQAGLSVGQSIILEFYDAFQCLLWGFNNSD